MKNHYASQFVIRDFNSLPYFFDIKKGTLTKRQPKKIFYETSDMYSDEVERLANEKVETPFSILLKDKLNEEEVTLTRENISI